ncbi:MAG: hypothetical protein R3B40_28865 [Polyangiales bacterium]
MRPLKIPLQLGVRANLYCARIGQAVGIPGGTRGDYRLSFEPIEGAYVAFTQEGAPGYTLGRSNNYGHVFLRVPSAIRTAAPVNQVSTLSDAVVLYPGARYKAFWTYDPAVFDRVVRALDRNLQQGERHYRFLNVSLLGAPEDTIRFAGIGEAEERTVRALLLRGAEGGTIMAHDGHYQPAILGTVAAPITTPVLDLTPPAFRALYLAEWTTDASRRIVSTRADQWAQLTRVREIARAAQEGLPIAELESQLADSGLAAAWATRYRAYAHACANVASPAPSAAASSGGDPSHGIAQVVRAQFEQAIHVQVNDRSWRIAAAAIYQAHRIPHPVASQGGPGQAHNTYLGSATPTHYPDSHARDALLSYFRLYQQGLTWSRQAVPAIVEGNHSVERTLHAIGQKRKGMLPRALARDFVESVHWHTKPGEPREEHRVDITDRYSAATMAEGIAWVHAIAALIQLPAEPGEPTWWDAEGHDLFSWVKNAPRRTGSLLGKVFEEATKRVQWTRDRAADAEALLNDAYRIHRAIEDNVTVLEGARHSGTSRVSVTLAPDGHGTHRLTIAEDQVRPRHIDRVVVVRESTRARRGSHGELRTDPQFQHRFTVEAPFVPLWKRLGLATPEIFSEVTSLIGVGIVVADMVHSDDFDAYLGVQLADNVFGVVKSSYGVLAALHAEAPRGDWMRLLRSASSSAGDLGNLLGFVTGPHSITSGMELLTLESATGRGAIAHGNDRLAYLVMCRGAAQITLGVTTTGAAIATAASLAGVAVGTVVPVLGWAVLISQICLLAADAAVEIADGDALDERIETYNVVIREEFAQGGRARLAGSLGTLNTALRHHRPPLR